MLSEFQTTKTGKERSSFWFRNTLLALILSVLVILAYGICIEPYDIEIRHINIRDEALSKVLANRVVVHLSDFHIAKIGTAEKKVLSLLQQLNPDLILLTGDYIKWKGDYAPALNFLAQLHAKEGVWAVMGDYDYSDSRKSCLFCHEEGSGRLTKAHSVHFLRDNARTINLPEGSITIAGLDAESDKKSLKEFSLRTSQKVPVILLTHSPLNFNNFSERQNIFLLAGDTHGGQVALPTWLFGLMGYKKNVLYNQGLFEQGRKKMFVTKGIGTTHLPIRFLRKPEIIVLHFMAE